MNTQQQVVLPRRRRIVEDAVSGLGMSRGPHLSIRGGRFRLVGVNGQEKLIETHYLDIIIVDANDKPARVYFGGKVWDPNSNDPPVCFSDNGTGPSTQSLEPQAPTCAVCPNNMRGSDTTFSGKPTTACDNRKKLAFVLPDDMSCTVYEFQIPPGSLSNMKAYGKWISEQGTSPVHGDALDLADVVTRIMFDPEKQFVLQFSASAWADDDSTLKLIEHIHLNNLADSAVGRLDVAHVPADVSRMLEARSTMGALPAPAAAALAPQQFAPALPLRQAPLAAPLQQPASPAPGPTAPTARRGRGPAKGNGPTAAPASPFTASAQQPAGAPTSSFAAPEAQQEVIPPQRADSLNIPDFLKRAPAGVPPAPPTPRFGVGAAPAPPAAVADAINQAMSLPTRR